MTDYVDKGAVISSDRNYRYHLWREWRGTHDPNHWRWIGNEKDGNGNRIGEPKSCLFIMFNPSTADGEKDDPTIVRCVNFAKRRNYEKLEVVNLFAYRSSSPIDIFNIESLDEQIGPRNMEFVELAVENSGLIICAWGMHGDYCDQGNTVLGWINRKTYCLGTPTVNGQPRHPLYLPADASLKLYSDNIA